MKSFFQAMLKSYGFVPILFGTLIFINYFFGWDRMFKGQMSPPNPFFAFALFILGVVWTVRFQKRVK